MSVPLDVWQVGTGDSGRPYIDWMLENHVVAIGSGWGGEWPSEAYGGAEAADIRRFVEEVKDGDLIIARHGKREALAIGVVGPYQFDQDLDDVQGWDLCHTRRVRWLVTEPHQFARLALAQGRFCRCRDDEVLAWVEQNIAGMSLAAPDVSALPEVTSLGPGSRHQDARPRAAGGRRTSEEVVEQHLGWWLRPRRAERE